MNEVDVSLSEVALEHLRRMCGEEAARAGGPKILYRVAQRMKIAPQSLSFILPTPRGRTVTLKHLENIRQSDRLKASELLRMLAELAEELEKPSAVPQIAKVTLGGQETFYAKFTTSDGKERVAWIRPDAVGGLPAPDTMRLLEAPRPRAKRTKSSKK